MYLAFLALGLALLAHGAATRHQEGLRSADADILQRVGIQAVEAQQIGRIAALLLAAPDTRAASVESLGRALTESTTQALILDERLARQMATSDHGARLLAQPLQAWNSAREQLWQRARALLRQASAAAASQASEAGSATELRHAVMAVQVEGANTWAQADALSRALQSAAAERSRQFARQAELNVGALLLLLLLLSLAVVEPIVASVRRHGQRLQDQATELQRLALVAEHTQAVVLLTDTDDRIVWANEAFGRVAGWTADEARGQVMAGLMGHPQADAAAREAMADALAGGQGLRLEVQYRRRDGSDLWLDVDHRPVHNDSGQMTGFVSVCIDVTARVQQAAKLQALWAALPAGVVVHALDGTITDANPAAERLLGLTLGQLQGRDPMDPRWQVVRDDGSPYPGEDHPAMRTLACGHGSRGETMGIHKPEGELRWLLVHTEPQRDVHGQLRGVVACFSDITEPRRLQDKLHVHSRTDALTGLANRIVVMERLQRAIEHTRRNPGYGFAVLFLDLDRFRQINDTLGHSAGDDVLRQVAERLRLALRPGDEIGRLAAQGELAARLGGDKFVVVLEGVSDRHDVDAVASRVLHELAQPFWVRDVPVHTSASIGVVVSGPGLTTAEQVLGHADTAMYEAKQIGRGRWVTFDHALQEGVARTLAMENDLRRALIEDELIVVYQPVVELATRKVIAVEALVRWQHPTRGLVLPNDFIPVAEECGLIHAVGALVLAKACGQFALWQGSMGERAPQRLAVNVSRFQLVQPGLSAEVQQQLTASRMLPVQLQLEVTESPAFDDRWQAALRELKSLGVHLSLDQFGTGHSSLAGLHRLAVDSVKIDRGFVGQVDSNVHHGLVVEATIRVAVELGMSTVGVGIETEAQAELMRRMNCNGGQGFLFSPPVGAEEFERWLAASAGCASESLAS